MANQNTILSRVVTATWMSLALTAGATGTAMATEGLSANVAVGSNYLWRGVSQTDDGAAVSGGIDYASKSGFYIGTWVSNVDFGDDTNAEVDLYGGYGGSQGDFGYDVGYIYYGYPGGDDLNFSEVYASASWKYLSVGVSSLADADWDADFGDDIYLEANLTFEVSPGLELAFHVGNYDFDEGTDYTDYSVSLSKNGFSLMVSDVDEDLVSEDLQVVVSYSMDIDL